MAWCGYWWFVTWSAPSQHKRVHSYGKCLNLPKENKLWYILSVSVLIRLYSSNRNKTKSIQTPIRIPHQNVRANSKERPRRTFGLSRGRRQPITSEDIARGMIPKWKSSAMRSHAETAPDPCQRLVTVSAPIHHMWRYCGWVYLNLPREWEQILVCCICVCACWLGFMIAGRKVLCKKATRRKCSSIL